MATRTRSSVSAAVQYEDITPKTEWKEEDRANILLIHAPDFVKEQLKITSVHSTRTIRVTGERKVASNRGIRFDETFPVPQNCDVQNIQAKFVNGTLTITMPKSTITQDTPPKPDPKPTTATQDAVPLPKPGASTAPTPPALSQNATTEPKVEKGVEEQEKAAATLQKATTLQEVLKDSKSQMGQEDQATLRAPSSSKLDDLTTTMPKSTITQATPPKPDPKPATATQDAVPPPKPAASTTPSPPVLSQNATIEPKEEKGVEEKEKAAATLQKAPTLQEVLKDSEPQKGQEDQATLRAPSSSKLDDLTITMPKSTITQAPPPRPDPKPTTATQDVVPPSKLAASTTPTPRVVPQNATTEPKEEKGVEEKEKAAATLQKAPTLQEVLKPQKGQEDQATLRAPFSSKLDDTALLKQKDETVVKEEKKEASVGGDQKSLPEQDQEEIGKKRKESSNAPPEGDNESVKKRKESSIGEDRSGSSSVKETLLEKERPSTYKEDTVGGKMKNVAAAAKDALKGLAMELREDRQKMVNIGVAVLVIAAAGAYLYYRYKSNENAQEE